VWSNNDIGTVAYKRVELWILCLTRSIPQCTKCNCTNMTMHRHKNSVRIC